MALGLTGVIHTSSAYTSKIRQDFTIQDQQSLDGMYYEAWTYLRGEEQKFYNQFFPDKNITEIEQFLAEVRKLLEESREDIEHFKKYCNKNLSRYLPQQKPSFYDKKYKLLLKGDMKDIALKFGATDAEIANLCINITPKNLSKVKNILNESFGRNFDPNSSDTKNLKKVISNKTFKDFFDIQVGLDLQTKPIDVNFDITVTSNPNFTKTGRKNFLEKTPEKKEELKKEMEVALEKIRIFLFGGVTSEPLKEAIESTWNDVIRGSSNNEVNVSDFFFESDNYMKSLLGQPGEFYNEVIVRYIGLKTNNPVFTKIIGSEVKNGQEPHSDLQIMLDCGANINMQTKNVNDYSHIKVNTNAYLIESNFGIGVTEPLVNAAANTDVARELGGLEKIIDQVKEVLTSRFYQAMNLNIQPELDQMQVNTFYFVGGNKIIPCSRIIDNIRQRERAGKKPHFTISVGAVNSNNDEGYRAYFRNENNPLYWAYKEGTRNNTKDDMYPTYFNYMAFDQTAQAISIKTSFSLSSLFKQGIGHFELFDTSFL